MNLEQAVVFAILMENDNGILDKSVNYILEKLESCMILEDPSILLDSNNLVKYKAWLDKWL